MASGQCSKWWRRRTNLEKTFISLCLILFITIVIIIIVNVVSRESAEDSGYSSDTPLCMSKECIETAGSMLSMTDSIVDPCDDFYEFACGHYASTQPRVKSSVRKTAIENLRIKLRNWLESTVGGGAKIFDEARSLYRTCMTSNGTGVRMNLEEALKEEQVGMWPVLDSYWVDDTHIERTLASLIQLGMKIAFEFQVITDSADPLKKIIRISPSHEFDLMNESGDSKMDTFALKTYIISTLLQLQVPMSMAVEAAEDIVSFESEFVQRIKLANSECGNSSLDDDRHVLREVRVESVHQISEYVPELDWSRLMEILYQENKAFQVLKNVSFEIYCRKYIRDLTERLVQFSPKTVFNYLGWKFFSSFIPYLGEPFRTFTWTRKSTSEEEAVPETYPPKWSDCLDLLEQHLLPIIATAHRHYEISDEVLDEKIRIASTLRSSLSHMLSSVEWLDDFEKDLLKDKVVKSRFRLAMTEITSMRDEVSQYFSELSLPKGDIINSLLNIQKFEMIKNFERMTKQSNSHFDWSKTSMISDKLDYDDNIIVVHFDKIYPPYLYIEQPSYLSFGSFATHIARDLLEYISNFNLMKVGSGNKTIWDVMDMRQKTKNCRNALHINESTSKDEVLPVLHSAMPDLTSIGVSFKAYKSLNDQGNDYLPGLPYTDDQMFFISYAQSFCETPRGDGETLWGEDNRMTSRQRVNHVLKNFQPFSESFICESGSQMKPPLPCSAMGT